MLALQQTQGVKLNFFPSGLFMPDPKHFRQFFVISDVISITCLSRVFDEQILALPLCRAGVFKGIGDESILMMKSGTLNILTINIFYVLRTVFRTEKLSCSKHTSSTIIVVPMIYYTPTAMEDHNLESTLKQVSLKIENAERRSEERHFLSELRADIRHTQTDARADSKARDSDMKIDLRMQLAELKSEMRHQLADLKMEVRHSLDAHKADVLHLIAQLTEQGCSDDSSSEYEMTLDNDAGDDGGGDEN